MPTYTAAIASAETLSSCSARLGREIGVPVSVSVAPRASRISMRVDPASGGVRVSLPPCRAPEKALADFIMSHTGWIRSHVGRLPPRVPLLPGQQIPVLGVCRAIVQDMSARFPARLCDTAEGPAVLVGRTDFPEAHAAAALKEAALRHMADLSTEKAEAIGRRVASVSVKDTVSRWGSCSASGAIAYSWRVVFAPPEIADYLVAHEVSHLREMNHGPAFWALCGSLSAVPPGRADQWLRQHGAELHRYGPPPKGV